MCITTNGHSIPISFCSDYPVWRWTWFCAWSRADRCSQWASGLLEFWYGSKWRCTQDCPQNRKRSLVARTQQAVGCTRLPVYQNEDCLLWECFPREEYGCSQCDDKSEVPGTFWASAAWSFFREAGSTEHIIDREYLCCYCGIHPAEMEWLIQLRERCDQPSGWCSADFWRNQSNLQYEFRAQHICSVVSIALVNYELIHRFLLRLILTWWWWRSLLLTVTLLVPFFSATLSGVLWHQICPIDSCLSGCLCW